MQQLRPIYLIGVAIFFARAIWSLFNGEENSLFLSELQTGLLFLLLASITEKRSSSTDVEDCIKKAS
ncbi:hypothetical protein [Aestuariibacter salexigens]|uniref:hypothetical protein n=1 Tax=Aestuariibacter salexigens TaxID=226010 RepID=UPI00041E8DD5|nr:hypothetical protein [Aestuariibacter salexigens]